MDREKLIEELDSCILMARATETKLIHIYVEQAEEILTLLKEQVAVEPIPPTDESEMWRCGNCHHQIFRCTHQRFCERCGHEVKWDG